MVKKNKKRSGKKSRSARRGTGKGKSGKLDGGISGLNLQKFSGDILTVRNAHGLSQRAVAEKTGMTHAAIVFIESGRSNPLADSFAKLCQFFRLKPTDYINIPKGGVPKAVLAQ